MFKFSVGKRGRAIERNEREMTKGRDDDDVGTVCSIIKSLTLSKGENKKKKTFLPKKVKHTGALRVLSTMKLLSATFVWECLHRIYSRDCISI